MNPHVDSTERSDQSVQRADGVGAAHTSGPWEAERVYLTIKDPTMRITAREGALYIAEAAYSTRQSSDSIHVTDADEMRANARLIAAAPELLAHLQFAVKLLEHIPAISGTAQVDAMRAAIAKASGAAQ